MGEMGRGHELESLRSQAVASAEIARQLEALNEQLAGASAASGRLAKGLNWMTGALVVVGAVQAAVAWLK